MARVGADRLVIADHALQLLGAGGVDKTLMFLECSGSPENVYSLDWFTRKVKSVISEPGKKIEGKL